MCSQHIFSKWLDMERAWKVIGSGADMQQRWSDLTVILMCWKSFFHRNASCPGRSRPFCAWALCFASWKFWRRRCFWRKARNFECTNEKLTCLHSRWRWIVAMDIKRSRARDWNVNIEIGRLRTPNDGSHLLEDPGVASVNAVNEPAVHASIIDFVRQICTSSRF